MSPPAFGSQQPCDGAQLHAARFRVACPQRDKPWVLASAILGSSLAFIEGSVVNLALPAIQHELDIDSAAVQWVMNAYLLTLGSFMLVGGSLGDRIGLRRIFIIGNAVFGLGAFGCAIASSLPLLIVARCVQGLGGALLVPTSLALIGSYFSADERGRAIGAWAGASALTTAIGPVLGGALVDLWGWPAVFWLVAPFALLTLTVAAWRVPIDTPAQSAPLDYPGAFLLASMLAALILSLVNPASVWQSVSFLGAAAILAAAFFWRETHFSSPLLPLGLFSSRAFSGANLMTLLLYAALSGALYFLPFNLIQVQGYSATAAGAAFLPFTLMLGFGSTLAGDLIRRFDPRIVLTVGPVIAGAGFLCLALPGTDAEFVTGFLPAILVIGLGMTISVAPLTTVVMSAVADRQMGVASGINNTVARLAGVLAVAVLTGIAIATFSASLKESLNESGVPAAVTEDLLEHASQLAELDPPEGDSAPMANTIDAAIADSYIYAFRVVVVICGLLAIGSGVSAWVSLKGLDKTNCVRIV
jgi:EmrB/QacA subfamily drug resistance transporter